MRERETTVGIVQWCGLIRLITLHQLLFIVCPQILKKGKRGNREGKKKGEAEAK